MWVTISRPDKKTRFKIKNSVQLQFAIYYIAIILGLLIFLNTYPLIGSRDLVFRSKESTLKGQAQVVTASLSGYESLSAESVNMIVSTLDIGEFTRIVVTDGEGLILYDTSDGGGNGGSYAIFSEITTALEGYDVFYCQFSGGAFMSRVSMPIVSSTSEHVYTTGAVYIYESDTAQGDIILATQSNLRNLSIIVCIVSVALAILFSNSLTRRIKALLRGIRVARDGDYSYKISTRGKDELSELAREFNGLTERLQNTEEMRRRFVSDASHELKTPLASINLLSDSIVQNKDMSMDTVRDFVDDIGQEASRLTRTTERLLSLTRLDSSDLESGRVLVDAGAVAESALHMLRPLAEKIGVGIIAELEPSCLIQSTEDDLYQIIFNLSENGIKYNRPGGSLNVAVRREGGEIKLIFEDTGIGIPKEDVPHIFERFYRVDKARSRELGGSGLGLSIVRDTVLLHGGQVEVATRAQGMGTRFTVSFPEFILEDRDNGGDTGSDIVQAKGGGVSGNDEE